MKTENWLNCHVHAFDYFGGVARLLIPDNTYAEACDDMKTENWLNCHVHAFDYFGGVARLLIPDNTYAEACDDMKTENWLNCHVHAFDFFGGVARLLIPDNCKTATLSNTRYDLILNRSYQELAEHYGTAIVPARVRRPKDYRRKNVIGNSMKDSQNTPIIRYL